MASVIQVQVTLPYNLLVLKLVHPLYNFHNYLLIMMRKARKIPKSISWLKSYVFSVMENFKAKNIWRKNHFSSDHEIIYETK